MISESPSVNGRVVQVRRFECHPNSLDIRLLQNTSGNLDRPGTTASFFVNSGNRNTTRVMTAIHWRRGAAVHTGGGNNFLDAGDRNGSAASCMYSDHLEQNRIHPLQPRFVNRATTISNLPMPQSNVAWAIGGISLLLNENHASNASMRNRYLGLNGATAFYPGMREAFIPALTTGAARTFIGYNPTRDTLTFGIIAPSVNANNNTLANSGITYHDMYTVLRNLGCTMGLSLDGGGSTRFRATTGSTVSPGQRDIVCQLTHPGLMLQ